MSDSKAPQVAIMRSMLGRARGLGAAKSGTHHWWTQRATALALIPLSLWFVASVIGLIGAPRAEVAAWASGPITATLLLATIAALYQHLYLGLQVVIEDYIHRERPRMAWLLVTKGIVSLLALASAIAVLKLAFTG
jgi:succinate dehydrogenase / fumarate reductase membrane anchor subunit